MCGLCDNTFGLPPDNALRCPTDNARSVPDSRFKHLSNIPNINNFLVVITIKVKFYESNKPEMRNVKTIFLFFQMLISNIGL